MACHDSVSFGKINLIRKNGLVKEMPYREKYDSYKKDLGNVYPGRTRNLKMRLGRSFFS
jgi:hypothetical protein